MGANFTFFRICPGQEWLYMPVAPAEARCLLASQSACGHQQGLGRICWQSKPAGRTLATSSDAFEQQCAVAHWWCAMENEMYSDTRAQATDPTLSLLTTSLVDSLQQRSSGQRIS